MIKVIPDAPKNEKFQQYDDLIQLEDGELIPYYSMYISHTYRRMIYFKKNNENYSSKNCIVLPYLSERQIIFNHEFDKT
jgi:hypothetical protein